MNQETKDILKSIVPKKREPLNLIVAQQTSLKNAPNGSKRVMTRVYNKTANKGDVLKAVCLECVQYDKDEIKDCASSVCPIWHYRRYKR